MQKVRGVHGPVQKLADPMRELQVRTGLLYTTAVGPGPWSTVAHENRARIQDRGTPGHTQVHLAMYGCTLVRVYKVHPGQEHNLRDPVPPGRGRDKLEPGFATGLLKMSTNMGFYIFWPGLRGPRRSPGGPQSYAWVHYNGGHDHKIDISDRRPFPRP